MRIFHCHQLLTTTSSQHDHVIYNHRIQGYYILQHRSLRHDRVKPNLMFRNSKPMVEKSHAIQYDKHLTRILDTTRNICNGRPCGSSLRPRRPQFRSQCLSNYEYRDRAPLKNLGRDNQEHEKISQSLPWRKTLQTLQ
jgi:hypothetical protein